MIASQFPEIKVRQQQLLKALDNDLFILPAGVPQLEISRFVQDTNFFYLTGFPEQGAILIIDPTGASEQISLFVRENTEHEQVWDGFTMGVEQASALCPADKVRKTNELADFLDRLQLQSRRVYYRAVPGHPACELIEKAIQSQGAELLQQGPALDKLMHMRMIKSPLEIELMRQAINITGEAHHACMRAGMRYRHEYQFEAEFEYTCKLQGILNWAFGSIVAAGNHATCQHYIENAGVVRDQDLVLLDGGGVWDHYCADITRTFPASGRFSSVQRDLYQVVLTAEKAGIEMVAPGVCMSELHRHSAVVLIEGLKDLGVIKGNTDELIDSAAYKDIWPGALCHSLGLDVHDELLPGYHKGDKALEPGMVITVEPGFYAQAFNPDIPEDFRKIGIRIEDDILVTETGYENLSVATVKEVADVESMVQSGQ